MPPITNDWLEMLKPEFGKEYYKKLYKNIYKLEVLQKSTLEIK